MSVHELSEKSILKRKRVKQFQNAKVFPGLVGFHSEPNLRDVQISITKKNDLKTLAMKRKMSMSGQAIKLQANKTGAGMTSILDAQEKCPVDGVNMTAQNLLPLLTWK